MKIKDKTIIVTGAGGGIGRQLVVEIIKRGGAVIGVDINNKNLNNTKAIVSADKIETHLLDITDKEAVYAFAEKMNQKGVDGLINNAGIIQPFIKVENLDYSTIERVMNVNFFGTLYLVKALLPHFKSREEAYIVNLSSMGGFLPVPGQSIYGAAKAAVKLLTEALHEELKNTNIGVSVVFPGAVNTNIKVNSGLEEEKNSNTNAQKTNKILSPQEAAKQIIDTIENEKVRLVLGKDSKMMDFLYRIRPSFAARLISKKMGNKVQ